MSEEEKQAIDRIKRILYMLPENNDFKIILNLVEKQQKEIEEYKKILTPTPDNCVPIEYQMLMYVDKRGYISKDKIKEKLGYEEDEEVTEEQILSIIETMWDEFNRLEDLEDKIYTQYISKDVIKEKIKELEEELSATDKDSLLVTHKLENKIDVLEELLGEE